MTGGDGYTVFENKGAVAFKASREIVITYIRRLANATISNRPSGRMTGLETCTPASCSNFTVATIPYGLSSCISTYLSHCCLLIRFELPYHPDIVRSGETGIGDFIVNSFTSLCYARPCDGALLDPAFIRGDLDSGPILESELLSIVANSTARPFFVEAQFSLIKALLETGPDYLDTACDRRGLFQVSSKMSMDVDCTLSTGSQINNLAIRGVYYATETADNWYALITVEDLARRISSVRRCCTLPYCVASHRFFCSRWVVAICSPMPLT